MMICFLWYVALSFLFTIALMCIEYEETKDLTDIEVFLFLLVSPIVPFIFIKYIYEIYLKR